MESTTSSIRVTVLVDNIARKQGHLAEHGLAYWITTPTHRLLFDTGQGHVLIPNAQSLGIDLSAADAIALSHGHYDHTGGLKQALTLAPHAPLFLHPQALIFRYSGKPGGKSRSIGLASITANELRQPSHRLIFTDKPVEIIPGVHATGSIPRPNDYEDTGGDFYLDSACTQPDPIHDDQALFFNTPAGIVVVLGCAHAGVINTLAHIRQFTQRPIHAVVGGMHLCNASPHRLQSTLAALRDFNLALLAPGHCTGPRAIAQLWHAFPNQTQDFAVGAHWSFPV